MRIYRKKNYTTRLGMKIDRSEDLIGDQLLPTKADLELDILMELFQFEQTVDRILELDDRFDILRKKETRALRALKDLMEERTLLDRAIEREKQAMDGGLSCDLSIYSDRSWKW